MIRDRVAARAQRRAADELRDRDRMAEKGAIDISTVDQARVRDDLGFKLTDSQYSDYLTEEKDFNDDYDDVMTSNKEALADYKTTMEGLKYADKPQYQSVEGAWNTAQNSFQTIRVVNGQNIEAVYKLPAEVINRLNTGVFNKGDGSFVGNWVHDGIYNVDVTPRGTSDKYGKELHGLIQNTYGELKSQFWKEASPKVNDANTTLAKNWNDYNQAVKTKRGEVQGYMDIAQGNIDNANDQLTLRNTQKKNFKTQYEDSVKQRQALFK